MATEQAASGLESPEQLRRLARRRSHFWPGSGFALLGYPGLAWLGTASIALLPTTLICLAVAFRPVFIWSVFASVAIYLCIYIAEQWMCRSVAIYPGGEKGFLSKFFAPVCAAAYVGFIGILVFCFVKVGSLRIGGEGMMPKLLPGDLILYKRQVFQEDLRPGHIVFFQTSPDCAWGRGGDWVVARILALPGDGLAFEDSHYVVNGKRAAAVGPLGKYRPALEVPQVPQALTIPAGCYFVIQDDPQRSLDSRVLSWANERDLIGTRAIIVRGHAFGEEVE